MIMKKAMLLASAAIIGVSVLAIHYFSLVQLTQPRSVPASTAVPPAAAKQHNDNNDDEKRGSIHLRLPRAVNYVACRNASRLR
jgi:hypothetical protein